MTDNYRKNQNSFYRINDGVPFYPLHPSSLPQKKLQTRDISDIIISK